MKKKEYKNILILIGIILGIILITKGFNMFGSDTDWVNQHTIIPDYFRKMFYETGNLIPNFSFNYGSGTNMFDLAYYGFLSPIILLSYVFPFIPMKTYLIGINIIILILSAILFYKWLRNNKFDSKLSLLVSILFVTSGPLIFQMHRHMMFVNYMPFLILGLMGVDKLTKDNKKSLLIISTFLMIMTSFYYSVGGILTILIYFVYKNIHPKNNKEFIKKILIFLLCIFISVLMASILLLPTLYTLLGTRENISSIISLLIPRFDPTKILYGGYSLGLTFIALGSILWFCYNKKKNEKISGLLLVILFFIPIFTYLLNGGLYLRGKVFIPFIPLICLIIGKFIKDLLDKKIDIKEFIIFLLIVNILVIASNVTSIIYYIDFVTFIIILILYDKLKIDKIIYIYVLGLSIFTGLYMNFTEDYVSYKEYDEIFYKQNEELVENLENYRVSNLVNSSYNVNNIYNTNYYTTNIYSSTYNKYYYNFVRDIFKVNNPYYNSFLLGSANNIMFNTLLGNRYVISDTNPGNGYKKISNNDKYKLYENEDAYGIGFVNPNIMNKTFFETLTYPYSIEALMNYIVVNKGTNITYGTKIEKYNSTYSKILTGLNINKTNNGYEIEVAKKGEMDLYLKEPLENKILFIDFSGLKPNKCDDEISITIDGIKNSLTCDTWIYPNNNNIFHYVINKEKLEKVHIEFSKGIYNIEDINVYTLDYDNIVKDYDKLNIESIKDNVIKGNIKVNNDGYFMLTIPYDKGYTIYVNGEVREYELVDETFIGFEIKKGEYDIKIVYNSPWLNTGKIVSLIGFVIFFGILGKEEYKKEVK